MFPLLLGGLVLFALLQSQKRPTGPSKAESRLFVEVGGVLQYRPEVADRILLSYFHRGYIFPSDDPSVIVVVPGAPGITPGTAPEGAYVFLQRSHAEGNDIYAPTNAHLPVVQPVPLLLQDPGAPPPTAGMARLIRPTQPFPV